MTDKEQELAENMQKLKAEKAKACTEEINRILKASKCRLVPIVTIVGTEIRSGIEVVPE
jgi:hypothetical protein